MSLRHPVVALLEALCARIERYSVCVPIVRDCVDMVA